jgi:hypothetical protein
VVAVDVDGVLNPDDPGRAAALGYQPHRYTGPGPDEGQVTGTVWLHPDHGRWLRELAGHGAELVWCTGWRHLAPTVIAPRLGLPATWPVIDITATGVRWGHQLKLGPLYAWTANRAVAVLDDEFSGKDLHTAEDRTADGIPTLLVPIDRYHGLRRSDIDTVLTWLADR